MARFTHTWDDALFTLLAPPKGSQQIDVGHDGGNGKDGPRGAPGDENTAPGPGGLGGLGGLGALSLADGSKLKFSHANPLGTWFESATGGNGGSGGDGGDAGRFPRHSDYGTPWPGGGNGGDAGDAGDALASVGNTTIWGRTGTADGDGINLTIVSQGGAGGRAGNGGNADGKNGSASPGGAGGSGGDGGIGGQGGIQLLNVAFDRTNNASDPNHFVITLDVSAHGGNGGHGGDGGAGGKGTPAGDDGSGGDGGDGEDGEIDVEGCSFNMSHGGGGSSTLTIVMNAHGGNGGDGGEAGGPSGATGLGGAGGGGGITFAENTVTGGAENDTVRLAFFSVGGKGGVSGDGTLHTVNGDSGAELNHCAFSGGGGHNTLEFSWAGHATNLPVSVDLNLATVGMGGGLCSIHGFSDITGGSAADNIVGHDGENVLNGAGGDDYLRGMSNADTLTGGAGNDHFVYIAADESSGPTYDTITDLNFNQDQIGVAFDVAHVDDAIGGATINMGSFDDDIAAAVGKIKAAHAVLVTATHGTLHDHTFLVIEAEGVKGYQPGHDIVIDVTGVTGTMSVHDFFNAH